MLAAVMFLSVAAPPTADLYLDALLDFERYAESIWHEAPEPADSGYFGDGGSGGNGGIRGTCGTMLAYATLVRAGRGDPARRLMRLERGLRYAAATHLSQQAVCIDGKQWGHGWQTSLWAGSMAFACALVEDRIDPAVVAQVKAVVADEADYRAGTEPLSGYLGDSKAEENAWNSNLPTIAAAWLPEHPNAPAWLVSAKKFLVNSYTVADTAGDPLAEWVTTQTLHPSFACENHGFFHPSYQMVTGMSLADSWLMARVINRDLADELRPFAEHNQRPAWGCLERVLLDSGELAYPSGLDWALHGFGQVSYYAWLAGQLDDPVARWAEPRLAAQIRQRQRVNGDGRFTGDSVPDGFYREAVCARRVAFAWWQHTLADHPTGPATPPAPHVTHLPDVKLLLHRGPHGLTSLSYGAAVMGMVTPPSRPDAPFLVTPRRPGLFAARSAKLVAVEVDDSGFRAELVLDPNELGRRRLVMVSRGEAVVVIEAPEGEQFGAGEPLFPLGIENHAMTGGSRTVAWRGGERRVIERSGAALTELGPWLAVDGRLGLIAGPRGSFEYRAAGGYNRNGAAEDQIGWLADDPLAPRYLVALPGAGAETTRRVGQSLTWRAGAGEARLELSAPNGSRLAAGLRHEPAREVRRVAVAEVTASSESAIHGADLMIDGDPSTFWVSGGTAEPGAGPTPERPARIEFRFAGASAIGGLLLAPRPQYGPTQVQLLLDGAAVWQGRLSHAPLRVGLEQPVTATTATLVITGSHDPRFPNAPRNTQLAEVVFIGAE